MRMEGPVVALVLVVFVVVVALLVATSSRRDSLAVLTAGGGAAQEIVRDNVYQLDTCDDEAVTQALRTLSRSYRVLSMTATASPCTQLWIVVEPR